MSQPDRQHHQIGTVKRVEALCVVVIVAVSLLISWNKHMACVALAKVVAAKSQMSDYRTALDLYAVDLGHVPQTSDGMEALSKPPPDEVGWSGPDMDGPVVRDPWGTPYQYRASPDGHSFTLRSWGANGAEGGTGADADLSG